MTDRITVNGQDLDEYAHQVPNPDGLHVGPGSTYDREVQRMRAEQDTMIHRAVSSSDEAAGEWDGVVRIRGAQLTHAIVDEIPADGVRVALDDLAGHTGAVLDEAVLDQLQPPAQLPVGLDLVGGESVIAQRRAAIERLVDEHHLAPLDAQLHVDGTLADQLAEWATPIAAAFEHLVEQWNAVTAQWRNPPLADVADRDGDVIARVRARRGSGPPPPRLDGRRAS